MLLNHSSDNESISLHPEFHKNASMRYNLFIKGRQHASNPVLLRILQEDSEFLVMTFPLLSR